MFYRTNLTLSAFSNRLNLGTRSFALNANVNHGVTASRDLRTHHDSMRDRMSWYKDTPIMISEISVPSSSGSLYEVAPVPPGYPLGQLGRPAVLGGDVPVSRLIGFDLGSSNLLTQQCQRLRLSASAGQSQPGSKSSRKSTQSDKSKPARSKACGAAWRATWRQAATIAAVAAK
jgi:hypothetical protein